MMGSYRGAPGMVAHAAQVARVNPLLPATAQPSGPQTPASGGGGPQPAITLGSYTATWQPQCDMFLAVKPELRFKKSGGSSGQRMSKMMPKR